MIHGPSVFGVRPGSPFLYTIPATGKMNMNYSVKGLPQGLKVNEKTGVISGSIASKEKKEYQLTLMASNDQGQTEKILKVKVGDDICLTPPLGWNSWNCWSHNVSQENVLASAQAMVDKGLKDFGWTYMNIDWATAGLEGKQLFRDVWRQKDIGTYKETFSALVPPHGVILVKVMED